MLRKRISELRSRKTQTPEKQGPLGTPGKQDARPPTASLQEPEGVQVALSAIVSYHLPTHRSGWDEEGPDPPLELAVRRPETGLQPEAIPAQPTLPRGRSAGFKAPTAGRGLLPVEDLRSVQAASLPMTPCHLPPLRLLGGKGGLLLQTLLSQFPPLENGITGPRSGCLGHRLVPCWSMHGPLVFISRTSLRRQRKLGAHTCLSQSELP